jgi:hypothetical protein
MYASSLSKLSSFESCLILIQQAFTEVHYIQKEYEVLVTQ